MLEETLTRLGLGMTLEELEKTIRVQLIKDTQLIDLKVQNTNPILAADLANMLVAVFREQIDTLQTSRFAASKESFKAQLDKLDEQIQSTEAAIAELGTPRSESGKSELERLQAELVQYQASYTNLLQSYEELRLTEAQAISNVVQVEPATIPIERVRPRILLNTMLAAVVGGMIAFGAVFLIEYLDDTVKTTHDVERILQVPVLGYVVETKELSDKDQKPVLLEDQPLPQVAEAFSSLRTNIEFAGTPGGPRSILITSPGPDVGKTTVAVYLAEAIAQSGRRVILIDADLRRPGIHKFFGLPNDLGLSDLFMRDLVPQVVVHTIDNKHMKVITSGSQVENPAELFRSINLLKVISRLREQADVAIFDGPPLLVADAFILASRIESSLIVLQPGKTREELALAMKEQLDQAQANVLGVAFNRIPRGHSYASAGYLYYDYNELDDAEELIEQAASSKRRRRVSLRQRLKKRSVKASYREEDI